MRVLLGEAIVVSEQERKRLIVEANRVNYKLRSTFFYRKLIEYGTYEFPEIIRRLIPMEQDYDWTNYEQWGISKGAFGQIENTNLSSIQVFAHPRLLREHTTLTAYYRNVAALSQKAARYLSGVDANKFENNEQANMNEVEALALSTLFNEHISLIIENALEGFEDKHIKGLLFASTGAQIDGSWRNEIGVESEKIVQKMLIKGALDRSKLTAFLLREESGGVEPIAGKETSALLDRVGEFRGFTLKNKRSVLFSSEPDISLIDQDGTTVGVIEVKGGADPAGALERYGAAKKSFEESIRQKPDVITILVASCITSEVETRLNADKTVKKFFNLTSLLTDEGNRKNFLDYILNELLKCKS
ncbi:MAG: XcyI family restriction endonuclease [Planctomycetota bacterium]